MATTKHILVMEMTRQGNRQWDPKAKVTMGMAILGCAAALAFGGLRAANQAPRQPAASAAAAQAPGSVVAPQSMPWPNNSYDDLIWRLENAVGERVNGPAAGGPVGQAGGLSGGAYQDLIWELENAVGERVNGPAASVK
jgi:hypothetical protein